MRAALPSHSCFGTSRSNGPLADEAESLNRVRSSCAKQYKRLKTGVANSKGLPTLGSPLPEPLPTFSCRIRADSFYTERGQHR